MARAPRSKQKTLELCMEMYEWLRDNGKNTRDKYEWPRQHEWRTLRRYHNCFCCMFAKFECVKRCPLAGFAWDLDAPLALCTNNRSLYYDKRYSGPDKMVWACYVALNELAPKKYPLNFAQIKNP